MFLIYFPIHIWVYNVALFLDFLIHLFIYLFSLYELFVLICLFSF